MVSHWGGPQKSPQTSASPCAPHMVHAPLPLACDVALSHRQCRWRPFPASLDESEAPRRRRAPPQLPCAPARDRQRETAAYLGVALSPRRRGRSHTLGQFQGDARLHLAEIECSALQP